ncbi:hypothetical protein G3I60_36900 [Streptomyces sp. SID13666]|uniref:hypothetical protein n=1 Tax=unclassified Streptomyces TaxID=2593676 RepID=UPI0013C287D0|nr:MULTISPECIES: hypothetical protein [unclassified Streptomyces]NEA59591.1 hypothetical protein [Streptomyces sp. SID13666]NEA75791.1 hypothetical protein [Streptomyces sp. SID13588]
MPTRAGRPQGSPKGQTPQANELAALVRELTGSATVRELAELYPASKTSWSNYRSGAKIITAELLEQLLQDRVPDAPGRERWRQRANALLGAALAAERGQPPPASTPRDALTHAVRAQRQAEADLRESAKLVHVLRDIITRLQAETPPAGSTVGRPAAEAPHHNPAEPVPPQAGALSQATEQLARAQEIQTAAQVAHARAHQEQERYQQQAQDTSSTGADQAPTPGELVPARPDADGEIAVLLVQVRAALEGQHWELSRLNDRLGWSGEGSAAGQRVVRGELIGASDNPFTSTKVPSGRAARAVRRWRTRWVVLATVCAVLAGAAGTTVALHTRDTSTVVSDGKHPATTAPPALPTASASSPPPSPQPATPAGTVPPAGSQSAPPADQHSEEVQRAPALSVTAKDELYVLRSDHSSVWRWSGDGQEWAQIGGPASAVYAGLAGTFATHPDTGKIYKFQGAREWIPIGEAGAAFALSGEHLYRLAPDHSAVFVWSGQGTSWTRIGGPTRNIYAGGAGLFATNPDTGSIFHYTGQGDTWTEVGGPGATFAVGDRHLYGLSLDRSAVFMWSSEGTSWTRIGGAAKTIYAGGAGLFATNPDTGDLFSYHDAADTWSKIGGHGGTFAVSDHHLYSLNPDQATVYQWDGQDTHWTALGGGPGA